jgi:hypothetical protein
MSCYFTDDARLEAARTLDISKEWTDVNYMDKLNAINTWNATCIYWYKEHKAWADSEDGVQSQLRTLENAFNFLIRTERPTG